MCGAYDIPTLEEPSHPGLAYFLQKEGHKVANLAIRRSGNTEALKVLASFLKNENNFDLLIFLQSEFIKDFFYYRDDPMIGMKKLHQDRHLFDINSKTFEGFLYPFFDNLYNQIKLIVNDMPVYVVGGNTSLHPVVDKHFPNTQGSGVKIIDPDQEDSYFYGEIEIEKFKLFSKICTQLDESVLESESKKMQLMRNFLDSNKEYFNHSHANARWHQRLFDIVKERKVI